MEKEIKICKYRNCSKVLEDKNKGAQYCSRRHKECEKVYRRRKERQFEEYYNSEMKAVESIKEFNRIMEEYGKGIQK